MWDQGGRPKTFRRGEFRKNSNGRVALSGRTEIVVSLLIYIIQLLIFFNTSHILFIVIPSSFFCTCAMPAPSAWNWSGFVFISTLLLPSLPEKESAPSAVPRPPQYYCWGIPGAKCYCLLGEFQFTLKLSNLLVTADSSGMQRSYTIENPFYRKRTRKIKRTTLMINETSHV